MSGSSPRFLALVTVAVLCFALGPTVFGQSIPAGRSESQQKLWPAPVRHAQHLRPAPTPTRLVDNEQQVLGVPSARLQPHGNNVLRHGAPLHPHRIIESPDLRTNSRSPTTRGHSQKHPPHLSQHRPIQPSQALLPQARERQTWKTPYSYGYFGAGNTRQWTLHHGYRDRYSEWRLQ